eukprot:gene13731-4651_t
MKVVDTAVSMDCNSTDSTVHMEVDNYDKEKLAALKKEEGNKLYSSKDYTGAIKLYSEAIDLQPTNFAYYGNRCACYIMTKDYQSALNDARKSTAYNSNFTKGYLREAKCHMTLGSASFAKRCLLKALEIDPSNPQAKTDIKTANAMMQFESQAQDGENSKDYRKVEYCMRRLAEYVPDCKKYKASQAEAMVLLGKIEEAQNLANEILRSDISVVEALYVRGLCLYYQDNNEKAYRVFQQIFKMDPDYRKAKEVYRKIKLLEKTKESGNNAYRNGRFQEAYDLYTQALAVDPCNKVTNAKLHSNRANVCEKLNRIEDAIEDCNQAIEYDPKFVKPMLRRAKCYMQTEKYEEAVRDYEKLVRLDKNPEYRQLLREAKLELKKSKRKDYYKILGVSKTASDDEMKKAYRKEALKHHPDRHSHDSEEKQKDEEKLFKDVNEAYSVLSDRQKRMRYDNGQDLEDVGFDMEFDPNQIFQAFFGGAAGHGGHGGHSNSGFSFPSGGGN